MTHKLLEEYLLSFPTTWLDFPFGEGVSVYKVGHKETGGSKLFAIIADGSDPLRVSLKCDPKLAETLREKYESVLPGYHLNKKHWNTVLFEGSLDDGFLRKLIDHSYDLIVASLPKKTRDELANL